MSHTYPSHQHDPSQTVAHLVNSPSPTGPPEVDLAVLVCIYDEDGRTVDYAVSWRGSVGFTTISREALTALAGEYARGRADGYRAARAGEPCPTCTWPIRETVGLVCQTCATDYGGDV